MERRSTQTSKVTLFCTQTGEQIERLRAVLRGASGNGATIDVVDWKRALMATRLLAGSARVLGQEPLQTFLKRLTRWLEAVQAAKVPTTTQLMMLETVVGLEEQILAAAEACTDELDLARFDDDLEELARLIEVPPSQRSAEPTPAPEDHPKELEIAVSPEQRAEVEAHPPEPIVSEPNLPGNSREDALKRLVSEIGFLESQIESGQGGEQAWGELQALAQRLSQRLGQQQPSTDAPASPRSSRSAAPAAAVTPSGSSSGDSLPEFLRALVRQRAEGLGVPIEIHGRGPFSQIDASVRGIVGRILTDLLGDVCDGFRQVDAAEAGHRIDIELEVDHGRARIILRDNGLSAAASMEIAGDHLATYRGLRRCRALVEQLNGLIWVEPSDIPGARFAVQLPAHLANQSYCLFDFDGKTTAIPWVLVDAVIPTGGLVFNADARGESLNRHGHSVPLVDLSGYVSGLKPQDDPSEFVVIAGSVENRLGLSSEGMRSLIEAKAIDAPPSGWERVAYGGLRVNGSTVPVLDVARLVQMRLGVLTSGDEGAGSWHEPGLDSYVQKEPSVPEGSGPLPSAAPRISTVPTALVINQSEFRQRELARGVESLGYAVECRSDVASGLQYLAQAGVDLIVTDLRLGGPDTYGLRQLREAAAEAPLVLTSAVARESAQALAQRAGADSCWVEPFRAEDLQSILTAQV